ncbi:hypothetical protein KUV23_04000 [Algoriphagus marincola]|uniref:Uncharacterized protein n=1 Tax=Algoriphagus marincola TaxID=264027 RepID=A0ABS7N2H7_9BACT|nr:hypothetical protein [Algoriphagus marincola]MBY5950123.1 hypothetical protein [Algoriphagus marincola]
MKAFLNDVSKEYFLKLGNYSFSPIIRTTTGIALRYSEEFKKSNTNLPLFFTFPNRDNSALWISVQYLINLFFHDYIYQSENRLKELELKYGDKIEIFSITAYFRGLNPKNQKIAIGFSQGLTAFTKIQNAQFINRAKNNRVNTYDLYKKKKRDFFNHRRSLSKILELDSNPNMGVLNSKVILISGRGKAGAFRKLLRETIVNNEPLSETILLDENLLISPDFGCFASSVNIESKKNTEYFKKAVNQILQNITTNDTKINLIIKNCYELLNKSLKTKRFVHSYESLYSQLERDPKYQAISEKLRKLLKYHPGIQDDLISDVSAVFVNDLHLMIENPNTVQYLLRHRIPVYVICDKEISEFKDLDIYRKIFETESFKDAYRFNWDKKKVATLDLGIDNGEKFIDFKNNNSFYRFINQEIILEELPYNEFDEIFNFFESRDFVASLENHEILQKSYYQTLRPLIYTIKNSIEQSDRGRLNNSLNAFSQCFESSSIGLNEQVKSSIRNSLAKLKNYILKGSHPKKYHGDNKRIFFQDINVDNTNFMVPFESKDQYNVHHNEICSESDKIVFIGYPYREYSFKYIDQSIFRKIIPSVQFLLNQCEANVTSNFIKRKISSGYYLEKYPKCIDELNKYKIGNEDQLKALINKAISFNCKTEDEVMETDSTFAFEEFEKMLSELKYANYKGSTGQDESSGQYLLNSNVLHFENGSYVFLPHRWRILTIKESITGSIESQSCKIEDVSIGDIAVIVNVSRKSITKYLEGSKAMLSQLQKLDSWRDVLKEYKDKFDNVADLVSRLEKINRQMKLEGSPETYNILRWLHDDMMLAPAYENLKMVLGLKFPKEELSNRALSILEAKKIILKAKNRLDRAVKDKIAEMISSSHNSLEDNFIIEVQGIEVKGKKNVIVGIERRSDLKIEYHSTMKFLK